MTPAEAKALVAHIALEPLRRIYARTKNPLMLWLAYQVARKYRLPIPEEFFTYLDACAARLTTPQGTADAEAIARVFELKTEHGGRAVRVRAKTALRDAAIVDRVIWLQTPSTGDVEGVTPDPPLSFDCAIIATAKHFHLAPRTVRNIVSRHQKHTPTL